jgi:hypothetical protein
MTAAIWLTQLGVTGHYSLSYDDDDDDDHDDDNKPVWPQWLWATSQGYGMYSHQSNHYSCGHPS